MPFNGSCFNVEHRWIIKNVTNWNSFLLFLFTLKAISIIKKSEVKITLTYVYLFVLEKLKNRVGASVGGSGPF
jgi:hypothetical protein